MKLEQYILKMYEYDDYHSHIMLKPWIAGVLQAVVVIVIGFLVAFTALSLPSFIGT